MLGLISATLIPRSWLMPVVSVQRSALPVTNATPSVVDVTSRATGLAGSRGWNVTPSFSASVSWVVRAVLCSRAAGSSLAVMVVGEYAPGPGHGPAPAYIDFPG